MILMCLLNKPLFSVGATYCIFVVNFFFERLIKKFEWVLSHMTWPRGYKTSSFSDSELSAMIGCLRTRVRKQPIIALYFEFENELKFYNLEAWCTMRRLFGLCKQLTVYVNYVRFISDAISLIFPCADAENTVWG